MSLKIFINGIYLYKRFKNISVAPVTDDSQRINEIE